MPVKTVTELESTCVLLDPSSGAALPPDVPLALHHVVVVSEEQRDKQDVDYAPPAYVVTPQTKELIDLFFENIKLTSSRKWHEFGVFGTPGCGKSCAAKILTGEIRRRIPNARVFYSRNASLKRLSKDQVCNIKQEATKDRPAIIVVDQLTKAEANSYLNMAGMNLYVILLASVNWKYFYHKSSSQPAKYQYIHQFPFGLTGETTNAIMAQLQARKGVTSKLPLLSSELRSSGPYDKRVTAMSVDEGSCLETIFRWTNGHLISLAEWYLGNCSPKEMVAECMKRIDVFVREGEFGCKFYFEVLGALRDYQECSHIRFYTAQHTKTIDFRFINESGHLVSPFFLDAFELYLHLYPAPAAVLLDDNSLAELQKPFESGWVLERICLTNQAYLQASATQCLSLFPELSDFVPPPDVDFQRVPYRSLADIDNELKTRTAPFYVHFMPITTLQQKPIGCLQIYSIKGRRNEEGKEEDKVVVIGHQVTHRTAQEDLDKSLAWAESTKAFATLPSLAGKKLSFLLLFSCSQGPNDFFEEDKKFVDTFSDTKVLVADFPAARAFSSDLEEKSRLFGLNPDAPLGARKLAIHTKRQKSVHCDCGGALNWSNKRGRRGRADGCTCKPTSKCDNRGDETAVKKTKTEILSKV